MHLFVIGKAKVFAIVRYNIGQKYIWNREKLVLSKRENHRSCLEQNWWHKIFCVCYLLTTSFWGGDFYLI